MKTVIFSGCDSNYWKLYGRSFVNSFSFFNPDKIIHVHLINPDSEDLLSIESLSCEYSIEYINESIFKKVFNIIQQHLTSIDDLEYKEKVKTGLTFCVQETVEEKIKFLAKFSIFAMSRFVKLKDLNFHQILSYDIDSICLAKIDINDVLGDYEIGCLKNKKNGCVASLIALRTPSIFLNEWTDFLKKSLESGKIYGFLDQDSFDIISKNFNVKSIDRKFCNKKMKGLVITGKGQSKFGEVFLKEQKKWNTL